MTQIQIRRGLAAEWTAINPVLAQGEWGMEIDTVKVKLGNGTTAWNSLSYVSLDYTTLANKPAVIAAGATQANARTVISAASLDGTGKVPLSELPAIPQSQVTNLSTDLGARQLTSEKGEPNGYASLDGGGKVPGNQLPNSIMTYEGLHDVVANSPTLSDATGNAGQVYRVSVAGTRDYGSGNITLNVGDYLIHSGTVWQFADTTDAVSSINGYTGSVTLTKGDVGLGNVDNTADAAKEVLSASKLTTPRTINGVSFDGTANITVAAGIQRVVQTITAPTTLGAAANTDYVYFCSTQTTITPSPDTNIANVVAQLNGDGAANSTVMTDGSSLAANWTVTGNVKIATNQSRYGGSSIYFDGGNTNQIQASAASSNFNWGTSNFTVEFFVRFSAAPTDKVLYSQTAGIFIYTVGNTLTYFVGGSRITGSNLTNNVWYHIALCRSGTSTRLFLDGVQQGSTWTDNTNYESVQPIIGNYPGGGYGHAAWYDGIRLTKGVARYTSAFTPPTEAFVSSAGTSTTTVGTPTLPTAVGNTNQYTIKNTSNSEIVVATTSSQLFDAPSDTFWSNVVLLLHGDGENNSTTFTDTSISPKTVTRRSNAVISTTQSKFGGSSINLNSTGLDIATSADFGFGTGDFTTEFWLYYTGGNGYVFFIIFNSGSGNYFSYGLENGTMTPFIWNNGNVLVANTGITANTWQHHAIVRKSGTISVYLNGVNIGSAAWTADLGTSRPCAIGHNGGGGQVTSGFMDDIRVTKGVGRYSTNFSVPTSPYSDLNNTTSYPLAAGSSPLMVISDGSKWRVL